MKDMKVTRAMCWTLQDIQEDCNRVKGHISTFEDCEEPAEGCNEEQEVRPDTVCGFTRT